MGAVCSLCNVEAGDRSAAGGPCATDGPRALDAGDGSGDVGAVEYTEAQMSNGGLYKGQVQVSTGKRHGEGCLSYQADGYENTYTGQWRADVCHGKGTFTNGESLYDGQWDKGKKHGHGEEKWTEDETFYKGEYVEGEQHGDGEYKWGDGSWYKGQFAHDAMTGLGTHMDESGVYSGQFNESRQHGEGRYEFLDGTIYEGQFTHGDRVGKGTLKWPDGRLYDGQWHEDRRHGRGKYTDKKANVSDVYFFEGKKLESEKELSQKMTTSTSLGT